MANGRAASLESFERLAREPFLAIAEIAGRAGAARIVAAAPLSLNEIEHIADDNIESRDEIIFERDTAAVKARRVRRLGALVLHEQPQSISGPEAARILTEGIASLGIDRLPWTSAQKQLRDRIMFLHNAWSKAEDNPWPDLSSSVLATHAGDWLAPYIEGRSSLAAITPDDLDAALKVLLPWDLLRRLEDEAPTHFEAPTGSRVALNYVAEGGPVLAIRVQELFGLSTHPSIAGGRMPLTLHLLSPAHRPIQITKDLPGFWKGSWGLSKQK